MKMKNTFGLTLAVGLFLAAGAALAQTPPGNLTFEIATVKPSPLVDMEKVNADARAGRMPNWGPHVDAAQAVFNYMSLRSLIAYAYKVNAHRITGPPWRDAEHFDIVAKLPDGASKADVPGMLKALLGDRFKLAAHLGMQEQSVLALLVGKDGPKMKESSAPPEPIDMNAPLKPGEMRPDTPDGPVRIASNGDASSLTFNMGTRGIITQKIDSKTQTVSLESSRVAMAGLAEWLTNRFRAGGEDRPVVDMTGLKGNYRVSLEVSTADIVARARRMNPPAVPSGGGAAGASPVPEASDPGGGSSVFAAVKKLGLKLEPRKAPVEQLVIDYVEKTPTEK